MGETHYVYRINDPVTREFYLGVRSCEGSPDDDSYMGSYKSWTPEDPERLEKWVLRDDFQTREEANQYERDLLIIWIDDELNRNYHIPDTGFHVKGLSWLLSDETKKKQGNAKRSIPKSEEHKKKLREAKIGKYDGENHPQHGKKKSKVTRQKISNTLKGRFTGEKGTAAKLTRNQVNEIRILYATGDYSQRKIANKFRVSQKAVYNVVNNKTWKN